LAHTHRRWSWVWNETILIVSGAAREALLRFQSKGRISYLEQEAELALSVELVSLDALGVELGLA